ncbi:hypothetical protein FRC17_005763 [Serendipita sp. 399]|nr:hypothetical protein FRC17_005763 [Serendipita sp. 399]
MLAVILLLALFFSSVVNADNTPTLLQSYKAWSSAGCYEDSIFARVLPFQQAIEDGNPYAVTVERCLDACYSSGYTVAGLEWSQECFCGHSIPSKVATDGRCDMPCKGNLHELCGGENRINVYKNYGPTDLQTYNGWSHTDCFVDSVWNRALPEQQYVSGPMTIDKCLDGCNVAGFEYSGLEYGQECFCGEAAPSTIATDGRCSMPCNLNQLCGGGNGLSVYRYRLPTNLQPYKAWTFSNCFVDEIYNRVLPKQLALEEGGMTVEWCLDACDAAGYAFAGVEYGKECFCGHSSPTDVATDARCKISCEGNGGELCGGSNGISVYRSRAPPRKPRNLDTYDRWSYSGCFVDSVQHRVLPVRVAIESDPDMTIEHCLASCKYLNYGFAGLEYSQECWCGDSRPPQRATEDQCNMTCKGNDGELCGGSNAISIYEYSTSAPPPPPPQSPPPPQFPPPSEPTATPITTTTAVVTTYTTDRTIATETTGTATSGGYVVGTTTIVAPATITTTIAVPITATTTVVGDVVLTTSLATTLTGSTVITVPVIIPITIASPITASTTVPVPLTASTTLTTIITGSTTLIVPLTGSTTVPVTLTGPTTIPIPFTVISTVVGPSTFTSTAFVRSTGTATVPLTVGRTSFTLSIFTGTTSFVDRLTTIVQPIIILTTLARTFTTTTGSPSPFTTSIPSTVRLTTSVATSFPVTLTTSTTTPFTTTSSAILTFPTTSSEIDPVVTTSSDISLIPTTSYDIETFTATTFITASVTTPTSVVELVGTTSFYGELVTSPTTGYEVYTSTSSEVLEIPTSTAIVTAYTTTMVAYIPYTTTVYDRQQTTVTTTFASPITVTTTIFRS